MRLNTVAHLGHVRSIQLLAFLVAIFFAIHARAQTPTILTQVPADGATDVATNAQFVLTFNEAMDTSGTTALFFGSDGAISFTSAWNAGSTILTCTPADGWPSGQTVTWEVVEYSAGDASQSAGFGTFTAAGGSSGGGGTGGSNPCEAPPRTNTSLTLEESWLYSQTGPGAPVLSSLTPYGVLAEVSLASNLTASGAGLALPDGAVSDLMGGFAGPGVFLGSFPETSLTTLNTDWPDGTYTFELTNASPSFPSVSVDWNLAQPDAPTVANWAAAQAVDPTKSFTLTWNSFSNRLANTNQIGITIGYNPCAGTGFSTNLPGSATSVTIPANVLAPSSNYVDCNLVFQNISGKTSASPKYSSATLRGSITSFTLITTGGSSGGGSAPSLTVPTKTGANFSFSLTGTAGATVTVQYSPNLLPGSWVTLKTVTNSTGTINVTDTPPGAPSRFYRAHQ
jgi:hypothetical protein